jgi:hypothetical protein
MHDGINLEKRGVPTIVFISSYFINNAKNMARLKGIQDYPFIVLPHPVSSLGPEDINNLIKQCFPEILGLLLARAG